MILLLMFSYLCSSFPLYVPQVAFPVNLATFVGRVDPIEESLVGEQRLQEIERILCSSIPRNRTFAVTIVGGGEAGCHNFFERYPFWLISSRCCLSHFL